MIAKLAMTHFRGKKKNGASAEANTPTDMIYIIYIR